MSDERRLRRLENAGAENFVAAEELKIVCRHGGHGNGVAGRIEDLDGVALHPTTRHVMVDNDDHIAATQVVVG